MADGRNSHIPDFCHGRVSVAFRYETRLNSWLVQCPLALRVCLTNGETCVAAIRRCDWLPGVWRLCTSHDVWREKWIQVSVCLCLYVIYWQTCSCKNRRKYILWKCKYRHVNKHFPDLELNAVNSSSQWIMFWLRFMKNFHSVLTQVLETSLQKDQHVVSASAAAASQIWINTFLPCHRHDESSRTVSNCHCDVTPLVWP